MGITNQSVERFFIKNNVFYQIINNDQINYDDFDILIKSPGIPFNDKLLKQLENSKLIIMSDIELFYLLFPFVPVTAII